METLRLCETFNRFNDEFGADLMLTHKISDFDVNWEFKQIVEMRRLENWIK